MAGKVQEEKTAIRTLAWISGSFSAAVLAAHFLVPKAWLLWAALIALLPLPMALLLRSANRKRLCIVCLFCAAGFLRYWGYWNHTVLPPEQFVGTEQTVTFRAVEFPTTYEEYSYLTVYAEELDTRVLLYDYNELMPELQPGDRFRASVKFVSAGIRKGEATDTYYARNVFLRGYLTGAPEPETPWRGRALYAPQYAAQWLANSIQVCFPQQTATFLKALTTGEKSGIYQDSSLYVPLSSSGMMHIVAVSGTHVSYVVFLCCALLGVRKGGLFSILAIVFFAMMTGLSPSVIRAGAMQSILLLAPIVRRENDAPTSLLAALMGLLLVNPGSVGSVSLQLSFAAVAGLLFAAGPCYAFLRERSGRLYRLCPPLVKFICGSLSATIGATLFSTPLAAIHFGFVSMYGALTNLLVLWLIPICFAGGFLTALLHGILPGVSGILAVPLTKVTELIFRLTGGIGRLPGAVVSFSGNHLAVLMAVCYGILLVCILLHARGIRVRPLTPICLCVCGYCLLTMQTRYWYEHHDVAAAVDVGQGQSIALLSGKDTVVVDCGGDQTGTSGDRTAAYLLGRGRTDVDLLVLTHLHADHTNGVTRLMERIPVRQIVISADAEDEDEILPEIQSVAERLGTEIVRVKEDTRFQLERLSLVTYCSPYGGENDGLMILAGVNGYDTLITGDVDQRAEVWLARHGALPDGELLIAGHHGASGSTGQTILDAFQPDTAVISVGYNHYGHPAEAVLERLNQEQIPVYRTDLSGDVEIRMEKHGEEGNA